MFTTSKKLMAALLIGIFCLTVISLTGCKKKSEPVEPVEATVADATEQKMCPVMDAPINKELYTEYKDKKVYFCCPGCKEKFEAAPEKYLEKLPQFK
jgi:YHS domain-containing protein